MRCKILAFYNKPLYTCPCIRIMDNGGGFLFAIGSKFGKLITLPIGVIHPSSYQPRKDFNETELFGLSESIRRNGLLQPVSVRKREDGCYELIAGERRLRAARLAGMSKVPCIVISVNDRRAAMLGLIENMQREDLNIFEEAEALRKLMDDWGVTQLEIAQKLGKAQSTIANKLRLLRLTPDERSRIISAGLTERHARALLRIENARVRSDVLNSIIARQLTVTETESLINEILMPEQPPEPQDEVIRVPLIRDVRIFVNTLAKAVDSIRKSGLDAKSAETETDDYIEYTVYIPKHIVK